MNAVAVLLSPSPVWDDFSRQMERLGIALSAASKEAELTSLVQRFGCPPVVVYDREGLYEARLVLEWARRQNVKLPIVILVEHADFSQYQECMHQGASAYYELSAEPERIAFIIRQAAGAVSATEFRTF